MGYFHTVTSCTHTGMIATLARQTRSLPLHIGKESLGTCQMLRSLPSQKAGRVPGPESARHHRANPPSPLSHASDSALVISPMSGPASSSTIAASADPLCPPNVNIAPSRIACASVVA